MPEVCSSEAAGFWRVELRFQASRDEQADWSHFSPSLRWLPELETRDQILLCEGLRREGRVWLSCEGPEEAAHLLAGVRGRRVSARVYEPDGGEFLPERRDSTRGVYATPRALTRFVVRSVDRLLRSRLGLEGGLADPGVRLLDPAAGPANFLLEAYRRAMAEHRRSHGRRGLEAFLHKHLIPHFQGFEILPGPWAEGQAAMRLYVERMDPGVRAPRFPLFLADALSSPNTLPTGFLGAETREAQRVRADSAVSVVLGNPPFSGRSANTGTWIRDLLRGYGLPAGGLGEGYFSLDGRPLGERNVKWLQDDYVKFLRLAQWMIDRYGEGVVGFVVNHNCLEAPTFRGLRKSLLQTFDQVYALDLHGNQRRREAGPGGERDENVFAGVSQGIAVLFLVKSRREVARAVYRADLYGTRREKLRTLAGANVEDLAWTSCEPRPPRFLFRPSDAQREKDYQRGIPLPEIFPVHSLGVITGRDSRALAFNREDFEPRLTASGKELSRGSVRSFLFRPFDLRQILYGAELERPRMAVMSHLRRRGNLALLALRQSTTPTGIFVTRWVSGHKVLNAYAPNSVFPLYLFDEGGRAVPNLAPASLRKLAAGFGELPSPGSVLGYVYGVLHDPRYLTRFAEELRSGFPRVPLPGGPEPFHRLAALGKELMSLHLLEDARLASSPVQLDGDRRRFPWIDAKALLYEESAGTVRLTRSGFGFEGVAPEAWRYQVGSYPVLERWLKARAGHLLTVQSIREFRWIAEAVRLSLNVRQRIEEAT
ncbi:MAG TPA: type ISP restriction/modification enzyme [Thermoanaerobaculia bacterium]|jgi:predicted helicase